MSTNKKVAIISAVYPPYKGGIGNVAFNHARLLSERGSDVTVFVPTYASSSAEATADKKASADLWPDYGH
ncbi:hypothetical protein COV49_02355, partial [Candidatus Falkowbacteria bacterium CG11_big_fil_rev_8_21_14_0_20_39_10]